MSQSTYLTDLGSTPTFFGVFLFCCKHLGKLTAQDSRGIRGNFVTSRLDFLVYRTTRQKPVSNKLQHCGCALCFRSSRIRTYISEGVHSQNVCRLWWTRSVLGSARAGPVWQNG